MVDEVVKNKFNVPIGQIKDSGNQRMAISLKKGFVGHYSKFADITFDKSGKIYAYGDATQSLIRDAESE